MVLFVAGAGCGGAVCLWNRQPTTKARDAFSQWTTKCDALGTCATKSDETQTDFDNTNPTGSWTYKVSFEQDAHLHMRVNGNQLSETDYNPTNYWEGEWDNEFFGETWHKESDVVGTSGDKVSFTDLLTQHADHSWTSVCNCNLTFPGGGTSRYHQEFYGVSHAFRIWTNPLT